MGISDTYASTIIKVGASFGFSDFDCSPDAITASLGLQPDSVRVKGDRRTLRNGRIFTVPFSSWSINSSSPSKDVNDHLRELIGRLGDCGRRFQSEWNEPFFGVLWKGNYLYAGSGPFYERDVLEGVASLGASLFQDIYQVDEETSQVESGQRFQRIPKDFFFAKK